MPKLRPLSHARLLEVLDYNPTIGEFRWAIRQSKNTVVGSLAGGVGPNGYRYIRIDSCDYLAQRLAWFWVNKEWPKIVRFRDEDRLNCAISNLKEGFRAEGSFDHSTPEGRRAYALAHRKQHPDCHRKRFLKKVWGITPEDYAQKLSAQEGRCAICGKEETMVFRKHGTVAALAIDHDHATGAIRELLCRRCNTMIGLAEDDPEVLMNATAYLKRHAAPKLREVA